MIKNKISAHWGKVLFVFATIFAASVTQHALALETRVDKVRSEIERSKKTVNITETVKKTIIDLKIYQENEDNYSKARLGSYNIDIKPTARKETWRSKENPIEVFVKGSELYTRPKTTLHLKNFNHPDIQVRVDDSGFNQGKIKIEKLPGIGNQLKITGIEATFDEPLLVTVFNQRLGDLAKFYVSVKQQIKLYHYVPKASIKTIYDAEKALLNIKVAWGKAQVSITNKEVLKVASYQLLRKVWLEDKDKDKEKFTAVMGAKGPLIWEAADCPFKYSDEDIKPLFHYQYKIKVSIWHSPKPLPQDFIPTETGVFPAQCKAPLWLIEKSKEVDYEASKAIGIGQDKLLLGFSRHIGGSNEAELLIKKWDKGRWISGLIRLKDISKVLSYGQDPNLHPIPSKKKSMTKQLKDRDMISLKGLAYRITVAGKRNKNVPFDMKNYVIFMIKPHEVGEPLSKILRNRKYFDAVSLKEVFNPKTEKFSKNCSSFWLMPKNDVDFKKGRAFPRDMIVYFGSSDSSHRLRKEMKEINK